MIKSIFHFFKIHWKVIFGNTAVIVQDMLGVTPKPFNAVNVVFAPVSKCLTMVQSVMFAPSFERVVASERISVVHRSLSGMLPDMCHQFIGRYLLNNLGVNLTITLQKPKNNAFST